MKEIFKDIPGYKDYQASDLGRFKSLKFGKEKILKLNKNKRGYFRVDLCKNGNSKTLDVHQLIAITFLNHEPCGYKLVVDHIDNNPSNNKLSNLQVITHRENINKGKANTGVYWSKTNNKWITQMWINGKTRHLGCFTSKQDASNAYQNKLKQIQNG